MPYNLPFLIRILLIMAEWSEIKDSTSFPIHMVSYGPIKQKLTGNREATPTKWLTRNKKVLGSLLQITIMFFK